jgi:serine O-acetyltransferase
MLIYRLGNWIYYDWPAGWRRRIALAIANRTYKWLVFYPFHIEIPFRARIGPGLKLPHLHDIVLQGTVIMGSNCTLLHDTTIGIDEHRRSQEGAARVGDRVFLGTGAKVIGPITIGNDSICGANSVVTKDIPASSVVVGTTIHPRRDHVDT